MVGGAWWATVHGVTKSWTQLSNFTGSLVHIKGLAQCLGWRWGHREQRAFWWLKFLREGRQINEQMNQQDRKVKEFCDVGSMGGGAYSR